MPCYLETLGLRPGVIFEIKVLLEFSPGQKQFVVGKCGWIQPRWQNFPPLVLAPLPDTAFFVEVDQSNSVSLQTVEMPGIAVHDAVKNEFTEINATIQVRSDTMQQALVTDVYAPFRASQHGTQNESNIQLS